MCSSPSSSGSWAAYERSSAIQVAKEELDVRRELLHVLARCRHLRAAHARAEGVAVGELELGRPRPRALPRGRSEDGPVAEGLQARDPAAELGVLLEAGAKRVVDGVPVERGDADGGRREPPAVAGA